MSAIRRRRVRLQRRQMAPREAVSAVLERRRPGLIGRLWGFADAQEFAQARGVAAKAPFVRAAFHFPEVVDHARE